MALTADASRLFAVTKGESDVVLHVLSRPRQLSTDLQAGACTAGSALELGGTVVDGAGAPAEGAVVVLRRTDPSGQVTDRGRATSDASGQWSMEDTPTGPGRASLRNRRQGVGRARERHDAGVARLRVDLKPRATGLPMLLVIWALIAVLIFLAIRWARRDRDLD